MNDCFTRAGVKHGRLVCACKARVDFKNVNRRVEHFMVCPAVSAKVAVMVENLDPEVRARIEAAVTGDRQG